MIHCTGPSIAEQDMLDLAPLILSPRPTYELQNVRQRGSRKIIFLRSRGFAAGISSLKASDLHVTMTGGKMLCHHGRPFSYFAPRPSTNTQLNSSKPREKTSDWMAPANSEDARQKAVLSGATPKLMSWAPSKSGWFAWGPVMSGLTDACFQTHGNYHRYMVTVGFRICQCHRLVTLEVNCIREDR